MQGKLFHAGRKLHAISDELVKNAASPGYLT